MSSARSNPDLVGLTLAEASALVRAKKVSPLELTRAALERIATHDKQINAFITITLEDALQQAREAEAEILRGQWRGPLHGIPIALKDIIDTAAVRTTAASRVFARRVPQQDATVVERLRAAGAVFVGKTNLHEFAYGGSGIVSAFGPTRNPWDTTRITGGSSSGSAAAVAAEMCYAAIGTDTAGSIRLPAACCGVVGHKPTFGTVSARGVVPLSWSYDHVGPLARSVRDAALLLDAIAGYDAADPNSREWPAPNAVAGLDGDVAGLRLGVPREFFFAELDATVAAAVEQALAILGGMVREVRSVSLPVDSDRTVAAAESWAFHAATVAADPSLYDAETLRRIRTGENISAAAYIGKRQELELMRRTAHHIFADIDALITPTVPIPAPVIAELQQPGGELRKVELLMLRNTRPFNVLGLPTVSLPCGFTHTGLPIGLQIATAPGADALALRLAHAFEQATEWHKRRPAL